MITLLQSPTAKRATCKSPCHAEITYNKVNVTYFSKGNPEPFWAVPCPACGKSIVVPEWKY